MTPLPRGGLVFDKPTAGQGCHKAKTLSLRAPRPVGPVRPARVSSHASNIALIKTGVLVWDRSGLGEELRREWLSCQGVVDAQLDAYVGGSGEWATGADDDDDYEDECVAETWRDGGVLSEADA